MCDAAVLKHYQNSDSPKVLDEVKPAFKDIYECSHEQLFQHVFYFSLTSFSRFRTEPTRDVSKLP